MSMAVAASRSTMSDPDQGWKPSRRPQSTIAINFMSELDELFKLDGGIDMLDKTVHAKKQSVSIHTQELEALEAKIRETEERLQKVKISPPRRSKDSQRRPPIEGAFPTQEPSRVNEQGSPVARRSKNDTASEPKRTMTSEYVVVDRPQPKEETGENTA